jgi:large subunit ribosomal protein L15
MHKHKWFYVLKYEPDHFGKKGFKSRFPPKKTINVGDLDRFISKGVTEINLDSLGYEKLLAKGNVSRSVKVIVREASERAIKKIEEVGGEVILLKD